MTAFRRPGKVAIVGQGYVGLPVSRRSVEVGFDVVGVDTDKKRVDGLALGLSYVEDVASDELRRMLDSGRYLPTTDYDSAEGFDIAVITVPTPLRESLPDLSFIEAAARDLGRQLRHGATVILESTTYPGTTQDLVVPILEQRSGLIAGRDFRVGYSPERIDPGNPRYRFENTPKVVSGIDADSLAAVQGFYNQLVRETVAVSTPREAELTKLLENTFRHVNIALVNELAVFAHQLGINIWEAIDAASTKPFGYLRFDPGPGVGGHCLPVDPSYLSWQVRRKLGQSFRFVELANDINDHMPDYVVQRATRILNDATKPMRGSTVLLIGMSYKKNVGDIRESPALRIIDLLHELGVVVLGTDPHIEDYRWPHDVQRVDLNPDMIEATDLAVILTGHDVFNLSQLLNSATPVLDTRRVISGRNVNWL